MTQEQENQQQQQQQQQQNPAPPKKTPHNIHSAQGKKPQQHATATTEEAKKAQAGQGAPGMKINKVAPLIGGSGSQPHHPVPGTSAGTATSSSSPPRTRQQSSETERQHKGSKGMDRLAVPQAPRHASSRKSFGESDVFTPSHMRLSNAEPGAHPPSHHSRRSPRPLQKSSYTDIPGGHQKEATGGQDIAIPAPPKHRMTSESNVNRAPKMAALSASRGASGFMNAMSSNPSFYNQNRQKHYVKNQHAIKKHSNHHVVGKGNVKEKGRFNIFKGQKDGGKKNSRTHKNEPEDDEDDDEDWDDFSETDIPFDDAEGIIIIVPDDYVPIRPYSETMKPFVIPSAKKKNKCSIL